jgi:hypothetical protein
MLFMETVADYCENRTEHTNTLWTEKSVRASQGNTLRFRYKAQPVNAV